MKLLHRQAPALPITQLSLVLPRTGASTDPAERLGLSRLMLRLLFMGAGGLGNAELNGRLERLGATMGHALSSDTVTLRLIALTENLDAALELFLLSLHQPDFDRREFERLQDELVSTWRADREESKRLRAHEVYLRYLYGSGPQANPTDGVETGLRACTLEDVRAQYPRMFGQAEPILAALSDLPRERIEERVLRRLTLPAGAAAPAHAWDRFDPPAAAGRQVVIVPDAGTSTDEVVAGAFCARETDPDWHLHRTIALIFGGDMTSRLFRVIRGERGLSYGASCWYESSQGLLPRHRISPFSLYTFPSAEHTAEALPLLMSLYEELVARGVTEEELAQAKHSLINSHPFLRDTPQKLLALDLEGALYGLEFDDEETHRAKIEALTTADLHRVLQRTHHPERMTVVLLGDPDRLEPLARAIPGVTRRETCTYP
ncbi:MAG: insulinase family protein [Candidatus Lambdaproteobacteria bacterium]|nr:insulinase family protein [Candidatus Lambdaproteobacteria bacterium]